MIRNSYESCPFVKFYWKTAGLIPSRLICGCFCVTTAALNSCCSRRHRAHTAENMYYLTISEAVHGSLLQSKAVPALRPPKFFLLPMPVGVGSLPERCPPGFKDEKQKIQREHRPGWVAQLTMNRTSTLAPPHRLASWISTLSSQPGPCAQKGSVLGLVPSYHNLEILFFLAFLFCTGLCLALPMPSPQPLQTFPFANHILFQHYNFQSPQHINIREIDIRAASMFSFQHNLQSKAHVFPPL